MSRRGPVCLLTLAMLGPSCTSDEPYSRAYTIESLDQGVGGPKALAEIGDFVLENDRVRVAILASGEGEPDLGPGLYGGSIVDADLQWNDARFPRGYGNDQMAEVFATVNMNIIAANGAGSVRILSDGSDGGPAIVRVEGKAEPFITLLGALWALVGAPDMGLVTDYIAEPGKPWITMRTTATVGWDGVAALSGEGAAVDYPPDDMPLLDWTIESGVTFGDFYLQGGAIDVFAPGMGFDEDLEVYEAGVQGKNTIQEPFQYEFLAGVGDGVSYGIAPKEGTSYVPLFTSSQTAMFGGGKQGEGNDRFPEGTTLTYERYLFVGHGDVGSIVDAYIEARGIPYGEVTGHVLEDGTAAPLAKASVLAYRVTDGVRADRPWNAWITDVDPRDSRLDGSFGGRLPVGTWELQAHLDGRPDQDPLRVEVTEGSATRVALEAGRAGVLTFTVRDELGRAVPAKVTIFREGGSLRDTRVGDAYVAGAPQAVVFPMYGDGLVELPPGDYTAVASRGVEYELDVSEVFHVDDQRAAHVDLTVVRSVDTEGWVSADLHVHAFSSHDSGVRLEDRVRTMAAEGVEFFSSTDHDYLTDYAPVIEDLDLEPWVQSAVGNEITTIEVGHFLGFPLQIDNLDPSGGATDWTGRFPGELTAALREQGRSAGYEPAVYIGHPRDGILGYFDQYGLDPYAGTPGTAGAPGTAVIRPSALSFTNPLLTKDGFSFDFDGLELLNGKRMELIRTPTQPELDAHAASGDVPVHEMIERTLAEQQALSDGTYTLGYGVEGQIDDWFTLLNLGYRFTVLGNSDTHGWTSVEAGCPRNYIVSDTDDPAFIDDQAIADAVRAHQVVASYGPFVQMTVDGHGIGEEFTPADADLRLTIDVQAPTWIDVDRVELYENGSLIGEWTVAPTDDPLRFSEVVTLTATKDAWYVVSVLGDQGLGPVFTPVEMPQIQLQNVVLGSLGSVEAVSSFLSPAIPIPEMYPVLPYAITNPVWVDLAGDGFDAPGLPAWMTAPPEPE